MFRTAGEYKVRKVSTKYETEARDEVRDEDMEAMGETNDDDDDDYDNEDSSLEIRNDSGESESCDDMISILPSEPVGVR